MQIDSSRSDRCLVTIARSSMHEDDFCPTSYRRTNAVSNCRIASLRESQRVVKMFLPLSGFDRNSCVSLSSIVNPRFASLAKNSVFFDGTLLLAGNGSKDDFTRRNGSSLQLF